jgi:NAD+ diphosphatase
VIQATPRFAFQHAGLDRAEQLRADADALAAHWPDANVLVIDQEGQARFFGAEDAPEFPCGNALFAERPSVASFLGLDGEQRWFALAAESLTAVPPSSIDLRSAALRWPDLPAAIFAQARALLFWQQRNRFCGVCANPLTFMRGGFSACCGRCEIEHYPRTDPAIIVAVSDGKRLLLGRQANWPERRWSVLAGFLEPGESLEQTVAREVMEEAGVRVHSCHYAASQPWPFPSALMLGFHAEAEPQPVVVGEELQDARWFGVDELLQQVADGELLLSPKISISRWLIEDWLVRQGADLPTANARADLSFR